MSESKLVRLAELKIELVPADLSGFFVLSRDGFVCLVERTESDPPGFGPLGSVCKLTDQGFAVALWNGEQVSFVSKGSRQSATNEELALFRSFARDLRAALAD